MCFSLRSLVVSNAASCRSSYNRVDLRLECTQYRGLLVKVYPHETVKDLRQLLDMRG